MENAENSDCNKPKSLNELISKLLVSKKKHLLFFQKPVYERLGEITYADLNSIEENYDISLPKDIRDWLIQLGQGTINDNLNCFPVRSIFPFERGHGKLSGFVGFASDDLGNYIAFNTKIDDTKIYYCTYRPLAFGVLGNSIADFLYRLSQVNYDIDVLTENLKCQKAVVIP